MVFEDWIDKFLFRFIISVGYWYGFLCDFGNMESGKKCNEFSEFIRHGEQAFRAIYSIYPDEYSVLRRFAEISDSYSDREILPFVRYYGQYSGSSRILHFAEKIEFETFFADCMAISPESVGAKLQKQEIDKIIKTYMSSI